MNYHSKYFQSIVLALTFYFPLDLVAKSYTGKIVKDGKQVATMTKTIKKTDNTKLIHVEIKTSAGTLANERKLKLVDGMIHSLIIKSHEFNFEAKAVLNGKKYEFYKNGKKVDSIENNGKFSFFDLVDEVIRNNWSKLMKNEEIEIEMLVPNRGDTMTMEIEKLGIEKFEGKEFITFSMAPSGILIGMLVSLGTKPKLYFNPRTKELEAMNGPMAGLPGKDPREGGMPEMGITKWKLMSH